MEWWSLRISKGFRTQTTNWIIFLSRWSWSDECYFFLGTEFVSTEFFRVSYTCSSDYSVYDGVCTYTHLLHAHFSVAQFALRTSTLLMRVTYTHGSSVCKKVFVTWVSLFSPSRLLPSYVSPIFCCLRATPHLLIDFPVHTFLPYLPVLKAQGMRISARGREVWLSGQVRPQHRLWAQRVRQDHFCGQWHDAHWRSRPQWNLWLLEKHTHKNTGLFGVLTMFESSVSHVSHDDFALQIECKESMHRETDCLRERGRKMEVLWSVLHSRCQRKNDGTISGVILLRLRKFFPDGWDLREHLQRRARQAVIGENSIQRKLYLNEYKMEHQNLRRRNSEYALTESQRELESQRQQLLKANQSKLNVREYICVANWRWGSSSSRMPCKKLPGNWRILTDAAIKRKILQNNEDWKNSYAAWSGITNSESILPLAEQLWRTCVPHQALVSSSSRKRSREVGMPRNTREDMSIPGNVFDCQHIRRDPDELHNDSRNLATSLAILRKEGIENSGSAEPLQSILLPCFSVRAKRSKGLDDK